MAAFRGASRRAREPEGGGGVSPRGCRAGRPGSPSGKPKPRGGQRPPRGFVRAARARRPPSGARARAAERAA